MCGPPASSSWSGRARQRHFRKQDQITRVSCGAGKDLQVRIQVALNIALLAFDGRQQHPHPVIVS
jgi:hypothetical protein